MKKGLVLEGGAMRGLWTAGVTDVMMEHGVWPDGLIGVSAGAAFGCNIKSRQIGRAIRYNTRFAKDARYSGIRSWLTTGDYFNAQFGYHVVPYEYDIFDTKAFEENPMEFVVVCTDVTTGQAVYHTMNHVDYDELEWPEHRPPCHWRRRWSKCRGTDYWTEVWQTAFPYPTSNSTATTGTWSS